MKRKQGNILGKYGSINDALGSTSQSDPYAMTDYRLTDQAIKYKFIHKPFEDKQLVAKRERHDLMKKQKGIRGSPPYSSTRYVNKLFDHQRTKAKELQLVAGCDMEYVIREQIQKVGIIPRGGIKHMSPERAEEPFRKLNIDQDSRKAQIIAHESKNRMPP